MFLIYINVFKLTFRIIVIHDYQLFILPFQMDQMDNQVIMQCLVG